MKKLTLAVMVAALMGVGHAHASECGDSYYRGQSPVITNAKLAQRTTPLCFSEFAVMFSGVSRTPLWSAEHLTADRVREARTLIRVDAFHPEPRLPDEDRSELRDYAHAFQTDRGHLSPNGDMANSQAQYESFSLSNIVPQSSDNNRHLWAEIEGQTRRLAERRGDLFVGDNIQQLNGRVLVPTRLFKLVFDPTSGRGAAYITPNAPGDDYAVVSIAELERISGVSFFPWMSDSVKNDPIPLPKPTAHNHYSGGEREYSSRRGHYEDHDTAGIVSTLARAAMKVFSN
jgi:endonuclease G, mitochondrial